jgi:hypothetical protein
MGIPKLATSSRPSASQSARPSAKALRPSPLSPSAKRCRRKFLHYFPGGFRDQTYIDWERGYKEAAHARWEEMLSRAEHKSLLKAGEFAEIAARAVRIESRTNLLFSFEKMALRDAVKSPDGARAFAEGLFDLLHGGASLERRFERWCGVVAELPKKQTRVFTWPVVTVFGFLGRPDEHFFLKPTVTRRAADAYGASFEYDRRPSWPSYSSLLDFCGVVRRDLRDLRPRDMIDIQSFLWVQGSDEYPA